ncbi:MAG: serine/threonine protein kinase [Polyangiaceae bacterium]|nr:serine/threonine protein kinase [Polyangiaceae bacterium]MCB9608809.1 serine/threonine protein kinase [Polyangiaceae bacterium]
MSAVAENVDVEVKPGDVLAGKYRVEKVLGAGGMGVVVQATHVVLNDRVALKFLLPAVAKHENTAARFLREAQAAVRIKSPHVARVIDVGTMEDTGSPYMVMEYLEGKDLSEIVESEGPLDIGLAALYTLQVCEALAAAHSAGVVHRDIKPANIFLTRGGDGSPIAKVLDFGISKVTSDMGVSSLTQTQVSMGSPLYMSPEQMRSARDVDARADIWSLGVVLYEMLTGTLPFVADSMPQLCALVLENTAPPMRIVRPDLPEDLEPVVAKCLEKDAAKRYQSVGELAMDLGPYAGDIGVSSAARVVRILEGGGRPRTVSHMEPPRPSMVSVNRPSDTHSTATAFGATGTQEKPKERRAPLYIAIAAVTVGLIATVWGFTRGGDSAAPAAPAAQPPTPAAEAPKPEAEQPTEKVEQAAPKEEPAKAEEPAASAAPSASADAPREPSEAEKKAWANRKPQAPAPKPTPKPKTDVFDERL